MRKATQIGTVALLAFAGIMAEVAEALADEAPVVAVFEIEDSTRRKKKLVRALTDYLRVRLAEEGTVKVVDKSEQERQMKKLVKREKRASYRTCVDASCQIPLGKELAADKILRSRLTRFGSNFVITSEIVDLASEASAGAASAKSDGTPEGLMKAIEEVSASLVTTLVPPPPPEPPPVEVAATVPPPPPPPVTTVVTRPEDELVTPPATGLEITLIVGGWVTFGAAYITVIVAALLSDNFASAYYSAFPIVGPVLAEYSRIEGGRNALYFVDAGVQLAGALVAVLGHVLVETKEPVPRGTLEVAGGEVSVRLFAAPRAVGLAATF